MKIETNNEWFHAVPFYLVLLAIIVGFVALYAVLQWCSFTLESSLHSSFT